MAKKDQEENKKHERVDSEIIYLVVPEYNHERTACVTCSCGDVHPLDEDGMMDIFCNCSDFLWSAVYT